MIRTRSLVSAADAGGFTQFPSTYSSTPRADPIPGTVKTGLTQTHTPQEYPETTQPPPFPPTEEPPTSGELSTRGHREILRYNRYPRGDGSTPTSHGSPKVSVVGSLECLQVVGLPSVHPLLILVHYIRSPWESCGSSTG